MIRGDRPVVIGVDSGITTGLAVLDVADYSVELAQVTPDLAAEVIRAVNCGQILAVAVERFVVGPRAARSGSARDGEITREVIGAVVALEAELDARVIQRSAAEVKPWASDKRLDAIGARRRGLPHAADAARHALFCAVADCGTPDPLSRSSPVPTSDSPR